MSLHSRYAAPNQPLLCQLPQELQDEIVSSIELHRDLIALALACRALKNLVVPRHSDYRILRLRHPVPSVWSHLARRKDLAKNIRQVSICQRSDYSGTDHWPSKLVDPVKDFAPENRQEDARIKNICEALGHMSLLARFTWSDDPPRDSKHEDAIFEVLTRSKSLKHLCIVGDFGRHARGVQTDPRSELYPLWRISNLETIILSGNTWIKPAVAPHICRMFSRSPDLEKLQLPLEFIKYPEVTFPKLKSLHMPLQAGARPTIDIVRAMFIQRHPNLEELFWLPLSHDTQLAPNSLPRLQRIKTSDWILNSLASESLPLHLESVSLNCLDPQSLACLDNLDRSTVRDLSFGYYDNISSVARLAEMFPYLTYLHVGNCEDTTPAPMSIWIKILTSLPSIEVFRGNALWNSVHDDKDQMHLAIMELVQSCLKLRVLDHCNRHPRRRHDVQRIVILREGSKGLNVRYVIEKPPPRSPFDNMGGLFD